MKIKLNELRPGGEEFSYSQNDKKLKPYLKDLVADRPFAADFEIKELGNIFSLKGRFKTTVVEQCSKCGHDVELEVKATIDELLVSKSSEHRKDQSPQSPLDFTDGPSVTYYENDELLLGDFLHEILASSTPFYPQCTDKKACSTRQEEIHFKMENEGVQGHPAFAELKNLQLN